MSGLGLTFLRRGNLAHPTAGSDYILSENRGDPEVFRILMSKGVSSDGVGITREDAEKVTSIGTWFKGNTVIETFDEFENFIGITNLAGNWQNAAFYLCSNLKSIKLPNTITSMGASSFDGCSSLEELTIPSGVTALNQTVLRNCSSLHTLDVDWSKITTIGVDAFRGCSALAIEELNLPSLTTLGQNAFYNVPITKITNLGSISSFPSAGTGTATFGSRSILKEIVIPTSITSIVDNCFYNYSALETCTFHDGITHIGSQAFRGCSSLYIEDLNLPSLISLVAQAFRGVKFGNISSLGNITTINEATFRESKVTKTIVLPSTLTTIGANAFTYATIGSMVIEATTPPTLEANVFMNANAFPLYVPDESVEAYKAASGWSAYASRIKPLSEYQG